MTEGTTRQDDSASSTTGGDIALHGAAQHSPVGDFYHGKSEAGAAGAVAVAGLRSGVIATIDASVGILASVAKFGDDKKAIDDFLQPFADAGILSHSEVRLGLASPKLSKFCKIGEYANLLRHDRIIQYFLRTGASGYTLVYQMAVLLDQMSRIGGDEQRVQELVETLEGDQIDTRQGMLRLTKQLKDAKRDHVPSIAVPAESGVAEVIAVEEVADDIPVSAEHGSDLVLATPPRSHLRKLREDYEGPLPRCLQIGENIADDAVMVVVGALSDLPVIQDKLLAYCGFEGASSRLFLSQSPVSPEVTEAQVIVVAERGSGGRARLSAIQWPAEGEAIEPLALAARLVPDAKNKLNIFASAETDGWESIVGEANWSRVDD